MEIKLLQKETPVWIAGEAIHQQVSFHAETVIPDTADDVQEIVWTRGGLLLKGKEPGLHAASVAGEAWASVLYLTENGKLESIRLRKEFEIVFEAETADPDALPHLIWYLSALQGKLLNPRKLSVSFEVQATLRSFQRGSALTETALPEGEWKGLHILKNRSTVLALTAVNEKPFTFREQLALSAEQNTFSQIDAEELRFAVQSTEQVGSRCIIKGELLLQLWGRDGSNQPVNTEFHVPFSQIIDITEDLLDHSSVWIEPNSLYLDWTEGIGGERSLDLEVHALLQFCSYARRELVTFLDAYSTAMPLETERCDFPLLRSVELCSCAVSADGAVPVPEDMAELLAVEAKIGALEKAGDTSRIPMHLDILYRSVDGSLSSARRSLKLDGKDIPENAVILSQRLQSIFAVADGNEIRLSGTAEVFWELTDKENISTLSLLSLDEEKAWKKIDRPSVCLVRRGGESIWNLAKEYCSSEDLIRSCNTEGAELLLIPAEF